MKFDRFSDDNTRGSTQILLDNKEYEIDREKLMLAAQHYVCHGTINDSYLSLRSLKKDLYSLDKQTIFNISDDIQFEELPLDEWYALGFACNKLTSNSVFSGVMGALTGSASYYLTSDMLFSILTGGTSAALLTLILFQYDMYQRNAEGDAKWQRFNEIFKDIKNIHSTSFSLVKGNAPFFSKHKQHAEFQSKVHVPIETFKAETSTDSLPFNPNQIKR